MPNPKTKKPNLLPSLPNIPQINANNLNESDLTKKEFMDSRIGFSFNEDVKN